MSVRLGTILSVWWVLVLGCSSRREELRVQAFETRAPEQPAASPVETASPARRGPSPPGPVLDAELHRQRRAAEERVLGRLCPPGPHAFPYAAERDASPTSQEVSSPGDKEGAHRPPPLGHFVPIEPESALDHFHEALACLAAGKGADEKVRILAYGASHTQADVYTGYLRAYLQRRFGDGGQGFVLLGRVNKWYRTLDTRVRHESLRVEVARYEDSAQDDPLGLLGAALVGRRSDGYGEIITSKDATSTQYELHYFAEPHGGDFHLLVDGQAIGRIKTSSSTPGPAYHSFEVAPGRHEIRARLSGNGPVRLFGIIGETAGRGVVVDTLGIGGARMESQLHWREDAWIDAVRRRRPALVTFAYGTNETTGSGGSMETYAQKLRAVVARLRKAAPEASCVLLGPYDVPMHREGRWVPNPRLLEIIDVQRRVSNEVGCGFWNGYAFMGGKGSMNRWVCAEPPLAAEDHTHLTRQGYVYAGIAIGDALMRGYDLDRARSAIGERPRGTSLPRGPSCQPTTRR